MDTVIYDVFSYADLDALINDQVIKHSIIIRGNEFKRIKGVRVIDGSLGISDCIFEDFGDLEIIAGDFWVSSNNLFPCFATPGNIQVIGGNANFRHSAIVSLGCLISVGGNLNLRDTQIGDLGKLEHVGENLLLPKRLQDIVDIKKIKVGGRITFWEDNVHVQRNIEANRRKGIKVKIKVPEWKEKIIYNVNELNKASIEQISFYERFKKSFLNGDFVDVGENQNYVFLFLTECFNKYCEDGDIEYFSKVLDSFKLFYPFTVEYIDSVLIRKLEQLKKFDCAWGLILLTSSISIDTILKYEFLLQKNVLTGTLIVGLAGSSCLTEFGQRNIQKIKTCSEKYLEKYEYEMGCKFFDLFFRKELLKPRMENFVNDQNYNPFTDKKIFFESEYYSQFYMNTSDFESYKELDKSQLHLNFQRIPHLVDKAIKNQCRYILMKSEDMYRESLGMPKVGEGWVSETELFYKILHSFPECKVVHHASPDWLGRQHIDIYFPDLNIGVEYQGVQHYKSVDFFGGEDALRKTQERDERKRVKCNENGCFMIYVDEGYKFDDVRELIRGEIDRKIRGGDYGKNL